MKILLAASLMALAISYSTALAGPTTPPAGPVSSTMKTLDEVEPRVAIGPATTPGDAAAVYAITQSGSYYLTEDVVGFAGANGIRIAADDVTIDLNGFAVRGDPAGLNGIWVAEKAAGVSFDGVHVHSGTVTDWPMGGVIAEGDFTRLADVVVRNCDVLGVRVGNHALVERCSAYNIGANTYRGPAFVASSKRNVRFIDCLADTCTGAGFWPSPDSMLVRCMARRCDVGFDALSGRTTFLDCRASENIRHGFSMQSGEGAVFERCVTNDNGFVGFYVGANATVRDCVSIRDVGGFAGANGSVFTNCVATDAVSYPGFSVGIDVTMIDCQAIRGESHGFLASRNALFRGCIASDTPARGFFAGESAVLEKCRATGNAIFGIYVGEHSTLEGCVASSNAGDGIVVGPGSTVRDCIANENMSGIVFDDGTLIENCVVRANVLYGMNGEDTTVGVDDGQSRINGCVVDSNGQNGIRVEDQTLITNNQVSLNGQAAGADNGGILILSKGSRIDSNEITQNSGSGILLKDNRNVVVRNNFMLNSVHITDVPGTNHVGAFNSVLTAGPWDNFAH